MSEELVFDAWTPMAFKRQLGSRSSTGSGAGAKFAPPVWVGTEHHRRLMAYAILRSYQDNAAREFIASGTRNDLDDRREYGEPALLVNTVLGALLGESQSIVTEGSDDTDKDGKPTAEAKAAQALQDWIQQWATDERLPLKVIEGERRATGLGDAVYSLGWSPDKGRPRLRVWDPSFYFPVLSDGNEDDYPEKVHLAWEIPFDDGTDVPGKVKVRRITWELGPIAAAAEPSLLDRALNRPPTPLDGDTVDETGQLVRQYAWNDKPVPVICYLTDATWTLDRGAAKITDFTEGDAEYAVDADGEVKRRDLRIDFIPVVHVPNTVSLIEHYGRSILSTVLQLLDDIASADTDLSAAAATTGHPVIALQGGTVEKNAAGQSKVTYKPGEILESGDGKLDVLDTSGSLKALIDYIEFLLKRLSTNSRVAEALLGRVKPNEVPSGVALALGFGPTEQLVKEMRLVRSEKYPLLLKFAHRLALAGGQEDTPPDWLQTDLVMGSFLPQDMSEAIDLVTKGLAAKAISLETAVLMLVEAGFPIRDAYEEVAKIESRDFEGAAELFGALGSKELVAKYLGVTLPADATPPVPAQPIIGPGTGDGIDPAVPIDQPGDAPATGFGPDGQPLP